MALASVQTFDWSAPDYASIVVERLRVITSLRDPTPVELVRVGGELLPRHAHPDVATTTLGAYRTQALLRYYRDHPVDLIQDWFVTYDPRETEMPFMPFVLFERQREFIAWLDERRAARESGCTEKSRDMGVTWLCAGYGVYLWLYSPGSKTSFGSRKESLVDKIGDPDSILEKARIIVNNLPKELRPVSYDLGFLKLVNHDNGAVIAGDSGDQIGRGGRSSLYFVDEAAFLERPDRIDAALSNNTDCRIDVSTANGMGNPFYRKVKGGVFPIFTFHWRSDPRKDDAWYAKQCRELEPHVRAQEIDIDYTASVEGIIIPAAWVEAAVKINELVAWPTYHFGVAGLDVGGSGTGQSVFIGRWGPLVDTPVAWSDGDTTRTAVKAVNLAWREGIARLNYDFIGVGEGVASTFDKVATHEERFVDPDDPLKLEQTRMVRVSINPINVGDTASDALWPDGRRSCEKLSNLKAELWWIARDRFQKTYEMVLFLEGQEGGVEHPLDELIALPDDPVLKAQLSLPTWDGSTGGKIMVESKKALKRRGIQSPDHAEALMLTFVPDVLIGSFGTRDIAGI